MLFRSMARVLGGTESVCFGVPAYFPDEDGIVREYKEFIQGADRQYYPSLASNLVEVSQRGPQACRGALPNLDRNQSAEAAKVNFRGPKSAFDHLSIGALMTLTGKDVPAWAATPLQGKIVLLGGAYHAARDAYPTPFSYLDGVDIIANTVDMNLPGNKELKDMPLWLELAGYVQGVVLLAVFYFVSRTWKLVIGLLALPVYALLVNWLAFQWAGTFVSFVPCLVGIVIHEIIEHANEHRRLLRENRELREQMSHWANGGSQKPGQLELTPCPPQSAPLPAVSPTPASPLFPSPARSPEMPATTASPPSAPPEAPAG